MGKCRCHHVPENGAFRKGAEYHYGFMIDAIYVTDDKGDNVDFDEITFLWYFEKIKDK